METGGALDAQFVGDAVRLAAAADTTTGASHHLDKVVGHLLTRGLGSRTFSITFSTLCSP